MSVFLITTGSSRQAITLMLPPHSAHVSIPMLPKAATFGEHQLEALRPGHGCATFGWRLVLRLIRRFGFVALTPFGGCYQRTVFAVRGEHAMKAGEVDSRLGHQSGEPGDER